MSGSVDAEAATLVAWRAGLLGLVDAQGLSLLVDAIAERPRLERLVARAARGKHPPFRELSREALAARAVELALAGSEAFAALVFELDRMTQTERSLLASMTHEQARERFGQLPALRLRRHGARLVWAMLRDDRAEIAPLAAPVVREYFEHGERLRFVRASMRAKAGELDLAAFEQLYDETARQVVAMEEEISQVERERAQLVLEIGRREAELRVEQAQREALARKLEGVVMGETAQTSSPSAPTGDDGFERRLRKLEKRLAHVEQERDELEGFRTRAAELERENQQLKATVERLRSERAASSGTAAATPAAHAARELRPTPLGETASASAVAPLVESPRDRLARLKGHGDRPRVAVLLDVANLAGAARRLYGRSVDYAALLELVTRGRRLVAARAYVIDKGEARFDAFAHSLRAAGFRVHAKKPKTFSDGTTKADWDVGVVIDALGLASEVDWLVLGSGDGDFVPLVQALSARKVTVEVAAFVDRAALDLKAAVDHLVELDEAVLLPG